MEPTTRLRIMNGTNQIASVRMEAVASEASTALYVFEISCNLVKDSIIDVSGPGQWLRLDLGTVQVLSVEERSKVDFNKAFYPSLFTERGTKVVNEKK